MIFNEMHQNHVIRKVVLETCRSAVAVAAAFLLKERGQSANTAIDLDKSVRPLLPVTLPDDEPIIIERTDVQPERPSSPSSVT